MEHYSTAFLLLGVGMTTVFIILLLVVLIGNLIVAFTNRFITETSPVQIQNKNGNGIISSTKMAAIVAAVNQVTGGTGRVSKIKKK